MVTEYTNLSLTSPTKFLGATVVSFNSTLGLGSSVSTLTVTLVEDCDTAPLPPDSFYGNLPDSNPNKVIVGDPVFFSIGTFSFGGIITGWDVSLSPSGRVFTVRVSDPRELLQNTEIIFDSFVEGPYTDRNYVNIYKYLLYYNEAPLCANFPLADNTEEGVPYNKIMSALSAIQDEPLLGPFIYAPTYSAIITNPNPKSRFRIDFTTFPGGINSIFANGFPDFYRLQGPNMPLLEILEAASDVCGFEYYVYLEQASPNHVIKIGLVDLRTQPTNFNQIQTFVDSMVGQATDITYGQELRNEKTKNMIIGDKVSYMAKTTSFVPFFGEEYQNNIMKLVVPYGWDDFGFWINKNTDTLLPSLTPNTADALNGIFQISELDIRMAMSGFKTWFFWVFITEANGSFNQAIRNIFPLQRFPNTDQLIDAMANIPNAVNALGYWINQITGIAASAKLAADFGSNPGKASVDMNVPETMQDLEKIHGWLFSLGNDNYGKKYLCSFLPHNYICHYLTEFPAIDPENDGDPVFSSTPSESAWSEPGIPVIGLDDPYLEIFKDDNGKLKCFAGFNTDGLIG